MKNLFFSAMQLVVAAFIPVSAMASDGIEITSLAKNNTLVRISGDKPLLILPVQEAMPDSKIQILVNGKNEGEFFVRLADSNVDYTVPFDVSPYVSKGDLILNIVSEVNRSHSRDAAEFICWDEIKLTDSFDTANREKYRPSYHHTPLYGWMNDPNGMFYKDGEWHLCYQWNPYGSKWQNMTWGHSKSSDLIHWQPQGAAITPDGLGTIFSGSAVVDHDNTAGFGNDAVVAIYTSDGINQLQSMAHSTDNGATFTKNSSNPILTTPMEARDPNMFWNDEIGRWNMILANPLEHEMLIFSSPDLKTWTLESSFGKGFGAQDGVWECPDLLKMNVEGTKTDKWVLICNINPGGPFGGSATQYFVGDFDGKTFTCDTPASVSKWMDFGKDHYAAVTWSNTPDGRHTAIAWMSNWEYANEVPTMQFRSANTLPRDLSLFKASDGEIYLASRPSPELISLRGDKTDAHNLTITDKASTHPIPELSEILADIDLGSADDIVLSLKNGNGEKVDITIDCKDHTLAMDRTKSGLTDFSRHFATTTKAVLHRDFKNSRSHNTKLRIFIDRSSIEIFGNDGKLAMTNLVFPTTPYNTLEITADNGKAKIKTLEIYELPEIY